MYVTKEENGALYSLAACEVKKFPNSALAVKILGLLSKEPMYPKEISKRLRENEQKIYYHVRKLERNGLIDLAMRKELAGGMAKVYKLRKPAFFMSFSEFRPAERVPRTNKWLEPFIIDGALNAKIIVGSPDPHGIEHARARDAYYAVDLALFLGTFLLNSGHAVDLDTDVTNLKENMIIVGGPVINRVTKMINAKMPIRFDERRNIYSVQLKRTFKSDDCGMIVKTKNPFDETKEILLIAGKRHSGTRAAILAFLNHFDEIEKKNAHVVEGVDSDGDGSVDDVRFLE